MAFEIARITDPGALAHVSPKYLIDLIRVKAPRLLLRLKKPHSGPDIVAVLGTLCPADEADGLLEVLFGIDRISCAESAEELLVAKGIPVNDQRSVMRSRTWQFATPLDSKVPSIW